MESEAELSWAENQPASEQQLPGWSDLDLGELYIIFNEHVNTRGRRPPHPLPSCKPARGRRGGQDTWQVRPGGLEETWVCLALLARKLYPINCEPWAGRLQADVPTFHQETGTSLTAGK